MLHIAVVDDEAAIRQELQGYLTRYGEENQVPAEISLFGTGEDLLAQEDLPYDIILLDIEMPGLNGMETAERIREVNTDVVLIFVTNLAQYAINGYEVGAMDFILKPINYYSFSVRYGRALKRVQTADSAQVLLTMPDCVRKLDTRQIYYVEVQNRMLHYHTDEGDFILRGTMQSAEKMLGKYHFVRCNHWYLVNLRHVTEIRRDSVIAAGTELEISRRNRTAFLTALTNYVGGNHQ